MNKILLVGLVSISSLFGLEFHTYKEGVEIQSENKKIIMIDVVRTDCHYCENMEMEVFEDEKMGKWIEERFIPVQVNLDEERLPLGLKVNFTPSFFFVNVKGEVVKKIPGSWNIKDFKDLTKGIK